MAETLCGCPARLDRALQFGSPLSQQLVRTACGSPQYPAAQPAGNDPRAAARPGARRLIGATCMGVNSGIQNPTSPI